MMADMPNDERGYRLAGSNSPDEVVAEQKNISCCYTAARAISAG